jgi:hypothetical protein
MLSWSCCLFSTLYFGLDLAENDCHRVGIASVEDSTLHKATAKV